MEEKGKAKRIQRMYWTMTLKTETCQLRSLQIRVLLSQEIATCLPLFCLWVNGLTPYPRVWESKSQAWWCTLEIATLERQRQAYFYAFKASLVYIENPRPAKGTVRLCQKKKKKVKECRKLSETFSFIHLAHLHWGTIFGHTLYEALNRLLTSFNTYPQGGSGPMEEMEEENRSLQYPAGYWTNKKGVGEEVRERKAKRAQRLVKDDL